MTRTEQIVNDLRRRALALVDRKAASKAGRKPIRRDRLAVDADVSYFWLCRFLAEHQDALNPRANTLAKLEKRLTELEQK